VENLHLQLKCENPPSRNLTPETAKSRKKRRDLGCKDRVPRGDEAPGSSRPRHRYRTDAHPRGSHCSARRRAPRPGCPTHRRQSE
jgi:hypothetical protein